MGCGASSFYSGSKGSHQYPNRNIRINIIEATSILDYEDTDTISSRRQTPVIPWQSQMAPTLPSSPNRPSTAGIASETSVPQFDPSVIERPLSPVPEHSKLLHRTSTTQQLESRETTK